MSYNCVVKCDLILYDWFIISVLISFRGSLVSGWRLRVCRCAHVFQEAASDAEGLLQTQLQLLKEVMLVKVSQLLQVPKDDSSLSPQVLRHVGTLQLRDVVLHHVPQRSHILSLRLKQLLHDALEFTVSRRQTHKSVCCLTWSHALFYNTDIITVTETHNAVCCLTWSWSTLQYWHYYSYWNT